MEGETAYSFYPFAQSYLGRMTLHVKASGNGGEALRAVREIVREVDPNVAVEGAGPASAVVDFSLFPQRFAASMIGSFGLVGLLLAILGVYGVLSFQVA